MFQYSGYSFFNSNVLLKTLQNVLLLECEKEKKTGCIVYLIFEKEAIQRTNICMDMCVFVCVCARTKGLCNGPHSVGATAGAGI